MNRIKAVLFDLDRTLVDRDSALLDYARKIWRDANGPGAGGEERFMTSFVELDARGRGDKRVLFQALVSEFLKNADADALRREFDDAFASTVRPFADAVPVVSALRSRGLLTGVVSNGRSRLQRAKLVHSGLLPFLDVVIISEEIGCKKPAPEIYQAALHGLRCRAEETAFVGDAEDLDITGPKAVEMFTILRRYSGDEFPTAADREVSSLSEIPAII